MKYLVTLGVVVYLLFVNPAIHFDNKRSRVAVEVHDEAVNDLLAAKLKPVQSVVPQVLPERSFFRSHVPTQFFGAQPLPLGNLLSCDDFPHAHLLFPPHLP